MTITIGHHTIGAHSPTYFIADIGANHDGDLARARMLIRLARESGADAAKFQNFTASKIVSDYGFRALPGRLSHQGSWKKSVFEVYADASLPLGWTSALKEECAQVGIDYFSSAYDFDAVDALFPHVAAYKIGSGDIDWIEMLEYTAKRGRPMLVATGACTIGEVQRAVDTVLSYNSALALLQCNTNYTGADSNFDHIHLQVLNTYRTMYPDLVLGLSDHTPGHATVLGAVALGARIIEKHFTDDNRRDGPDHPFAMNPTSWSTMVQRTRELERSLGSTQKFVAGNEQETVLLQRRCLRARDAIRKGEVLHRDRIDILRPSTATGIGPAMLQEVIGLRAGQDIASGEALSWRMLSG